MAWEEASCTMDVNRFPFLFGTQYIERPPLSRRVGKRTSAAYETWASMRSSSLCNGAGRTGRRVFPHLHG
jgi:hypothetical protein